ncbi:protocatechuate 3,4-dioxygenase [Erythrobacter sp. KY5]|uniref:DODA-type extradiol aromatic ring-opening family dioxygenase n=1 Tax=Erythrobacter sp. KY5 TaxID=2011159 RepID=UPI000DBF013F|nr:protocatechuate 3,4-dioxygenase [Erythrobacter sp. KY5]AWW74413.1 protocatechuate 3,4-dioxygenase [Erythrobacter sp. KY5]
MAEIVGGFASSHILMSSNGVEDQANRVVEGMVEIGKRIRSLKPDVILVATNDHMFNESLAMQAPFSIGVADTYTPFGDLGVPQVPRPGHRAFAEELLGHTAGNGFDLAKIEKLNPDHGVSVPMLFADPDNTIPLVPLYLNLIMKPTPTPRRCWDLAREVNRFVTESCTTVERVVVLGAGGLSHWVGERHVGVNEGWDRTLLADFEEGRFEKYVNLTPAEIELASGNGGLEIIHWLFMAGAVGAERSEVLYYEPMVEWMTGMGGIAAVKTAA